MILSDIDNLVKEAETEKNRQIFNSLVKDKMLFENPKMNDIAFKSFLIGIAIAITLNLGTNNEKVVK